MTPTQAMRFYADRELIEVAKKTKGELNQIEQELRRRNVHDYCYVTGTHSTPAPGTRPAPVDQHKDTAEDFGVWTLPATIGACRRAMEAHFQPAHYDAVERAVKHIGGHEITSTDVQNVIRAIETHEAAICEECGLFHAPPACTPQEAPADAEL